MEYCKMLTFPKQKASPRKNSFMWMITVADDGEEPRVYCTKAGAIVYANHFDELPALIEEARKRLKPILAAGVRA